MLLYPLPVLHDPRRNLYIPMRIRRSRIVSNTIIAEIIPVVYPAEHVRCPVWHPVLPCLRAYRGAVCPCTAQAGP